MELQELYDSQQLLTTELSDKLEKTEKSLEESERSLLDLEERHKQANATIKEKEFIISNLLKSEKTLVERATELRAKLENAASLAPPALCCFFRLFLFGKSSPFSLFLSNFTLFPEAPSLSVLSFFSWTPHCLLSLSLSMSSFCFRLELPEGSSLFF